MLRFDCNAIDLHMLTLYDIIGLVRLMNVFAILLVALGLGVC